MAGRQNKVGLDYFELDCHMDEKIELIEAEYGLKGFAIVVKLYQSIFSGFGYYCEWYPDISVLWARRLGLSHGGDYGNVGSASDEGSLPGFPKNLINDVVAASIRRNIFSKDLFQRYGILTSSGIQKRYLSATSKREKVEMKKEYLLISIPKNRVNVVINSISSYRNSINDVRNSQSRVEKRIKILCAKLTLVHCLRNYGSCIHPRKAKGRYPTLLRCVCLRLDTMKWYEPLIAIRLSLIRTVTGESRKMAVHSLTAAILTIWMQIMCRAKKHLPKQGSTASSISS